MGTFLVADRDGLVETSLGNFETFADAVDEAFVEVGVGIIKWTGDGIRFEEVAYVHGGIRDGGRGRHLVFITQPNRVPANWQPGGAGDAKFMPVWAPEVEPLPFRMVDAAGDGFHGGSYPEVFRTLDYFRDSSWKNDVSASVTFAIAGKPYSLFFAPARVLSRNDEEEIYRYTLVELNQEDGQDLEDTLDERDIGKPVLETDDPRELVAWVEQQLEGESSTRRRARMLELDSQPRRRGRDPSERPDPRWSNLELDLDDLKFNPGRRRRARRNPEVSRVHEVVAQLRRPRIAMRTIESPSDAVGEVRKLIGDRANEVFVVMFIDVRNQLVGYVQFTEGNPVGVGVHPHGVFKEALLVNAAAFITAHQHPSGNPMPSNDDRAVWGRLRDAGQIMGISCLDNLVIGASEWFSEAEGRPLPYPRSRS